MSFTAHIRESGGGSGTAAAFFGSALLHAALIAAFLALRPDRGPPPPPFYRVNLIAAAPSPEPAAGVVQPVATKTPPPTTTKTPPRPKADEVAPVPVEKTKVAADKRATPSVSDTKVVRNTPAPVAGGGEEGGKGADVGNIKTEGTDFPYPGYLENIVRQIRLRFHPPRGMVALKAEVAFLIRRDGTIMQFRFTQRSAAYTFDVEAQGAVEAAALEHAFGPLPSTFKDDVLPVVFAFDPRFIR